MLTVHHLGISQSDRIVWLCEELGLPYTLVRYDRDPATRMAPPEYRALHPAATAPIISDGDVVLAESAAIVDYLVQKYGHGRLQVAPSAPGFADHLFWFHFANGSMQPRGMMEMMATRMGARDAGSMLAARTEACFAMAEQRLGQVPYFGGMALTTADIMMLFGLTTMRLFNPRDISAYPNIRAYLQRIGERPAYLRAMAKADPDLPLQLS